MEKDPAAPSWHAGQLPALPSFLRILLARAAAELAVRRVLLFGSRAEGRHRLTSDYDLAFDLESSDGWAAFVVAQADELESLVAVDLVDLGAADPDFRQRILDTGVTLYERPR